jgi:hypothetical protein
MAVCEIGEVPQVAANVMTDCSCGLSAASMELRKRKNMTVVAALFGVEHVDDCEQ